MKKGIIVAGAILSSLVATTVFAADKEIVVATAGDVKPFDFVDKSGEITGYDAEVLKATDKLIDGYKVTFKKTAWKSIFPGIDSGRYQAAANNLSYTEERAKKYSYSLPIAKNPLVIVSKKGSAIKDLADIAGKTTHDDTGTSTAQIVEEWNKAHASKASTIDYTGEDVSKRLFDLNNGNFDYLIFDKISVNTIIKQKGLSELQVTELKTDQNTNNYIVFSKDSKDFRQRFNKAVKTLYKNGTLEKLSQKFFKGSYVPDKADLEK